MNATTAISLFSVVGTIQGVFFASLLVAKAAQRQCNFLLSVCILSVSVNLSTPVLQDWVGWQVVAVTYPFYFLIGPFLYLYIRSYTEQISTYTILQQLGWYFIFFALTVYYVVQINDGRLPQPSWLSNFIVACKHLHLLIFFLFSLKAVRKHQAHLKMYYSHIAEMDQQWIRTIAYLYLVTVLTGSVLTLYSQFVPFWIDVIAASYYLLLTAALFYLNGVAVLHPRQFHLLELANQPPSAPVHDEPLLIPPLASPDEALNEGSSLQDARLLQAATHIITAIEGDRLFLDPELTLNDLSQHVQLPPYLVSQAINTQLNKSFYDLINGYRVEEVKKLLYDPTHQHYKILSIAFQAGFNSKTVFNSVFKKMTGVTPTQYRKQSLNEETGSI
jgi:AraC-like DNA-binding protein